MDDDETILRFIEKMQGEESGKHTINPSDYGEILKSSWGEDVPDGVMESVLQQKFPLYKKDNSTG